MVYEFSSRANNKFKQSELLLFTKDWFLTIAPYFTRNLWIMIYFLVIQKVFSSQPNISQNVTTQSASTSSAVGLPEQLPYNYELVNNTSSIQFVDISLEDLNIIECEL